MDRPTFDQLFREHYPLLVGVAESMLGDRQAAEDVAQEVMIELWRREGLSIETTLRGYLVRAVRNRALNQIRHRKVAGRVGAEDLDLPAVPSADHSVREAELAAAIRKGVARLPDRCREVFELSRTQGLKYTEIAEALDISVKTVEAQMGKALRMLREDLAGWL